MKLREFLNESKQFRLLNRITLDNQDADENDLKKVFGTGKLMDILHDLKTTGKYIDKNFEVRTISSFKENKDEKQTQIAFDKAEKDINSEDPPKKNEEIDMEKYKIKSCIDGLEQTIDVQLKYQEDKTCIKVEDLKKVFAEYRKHMKV